MCHFHRVSPVLPMICVFHFRCRHWLRLLLPYTNIVNKYLYNAGLCVNKIIKVIRTLMFQHVILMIVF